MAPLTLFFLASGRDGRKYIRYLAAVATETEEPKPHLRLVQPGFGGLRV
jgi:hypothetical protein